MFTLLVESYVSGIEYEISVEYEQEVLMLQGSGLQSVFLLKKHKAVGQFM